MPLLSIALSQRSLSGSRYDKAVCFVFSVFIFFSQILLYPIHHIHPYIQHKLETIERVCVFGCVVCVCIHVQLLVCFLFLFTFVIFFSCLFSSIIHVRTTLLQHFRYIRTACMYTILSRSSLMPTSKQSHTHTNNVLLLGAVSHSPFCSLSPSFSTVIGYLVVQTHTHTDTFHIDEKKCLVCLHFYFIIDYVFAEHVLVWLWRASIRKNEHPYICMRTYLWIRISAVTRRTDRENDKSSLRRGTDCAQ